MSSDVPEEFRPRLCHIVKWPDFQGYGFNLHAEKGKAGQFIGSVDQGSPAQAGGLKEGDRIVEVNGVNIGNENHQQVVARIKSGGDETRLLVVDIETDNYYKDQKRVVKGELPEVVSFSASREEPAVPEPDPEPEPDVTAFQQSVAISEAVQQEPEVVAPAQTNGGSDQDDHYRPRLCHLKTWPHFQGYGFNLHAERDKPGQYIGLVDDDSPAQTAGLKINDRIIEVNGVNVEGQAHPDVIARIKAVPGETKLLVLDRESDAYYKERGITVHSDMPQVERFITPDAQPSNVENGTVEAVVEQEIEAPIPPEPQQQEEIVEEQREEEQEKAAEEEAESEELKNDIEDAIASEEVTVVAEEAVAVEPAEEESPPPAEVVVEEELKEEEPPTVIPTTEVVEQEPEPVNGVRSAPPPEPEPEFAVAPSPAPAPTPAPAPAPAPSSGDLDGLELNLSVAEMKERLKQRKKQDPRKANMSFEQKYKDFQRM